MLVSDASPCEVEDDPSIHWASPLFLICRAPASSFLLLDIMSSGWGVGPAIELERERMEWVFSSEEGFAERVCLSRRTRERWDGHEAIEALLLIHFHYGQQPNAVSPNPSKVEASCKVPNCMEKALDFLNSISMTALIGNEPQKENMPK